MRINASHPPELIQLGDLAQGSEALAKNGGKALGVLGLRQTLLEKSKKGWGFP